MIYGINFGANDIPVELKLKPRIRRPVLQGDGKTIKQTMMCLVGCCDTEDERKQMEIQATNGHRQLYWVTNVRHEVHCLYVY